jgi:hypothetical protein
MTPKQFLKQVKREDKERKRMHANSRNQLGLVKSPFSWRHTWWCLRHWWMNRKY